MQALRFLGFPSLPQGGQILLHDHSVAKTRLGVTTKKKKKKEKKRKEEKNHSTQDSRVVPHRGTN